MTNKVGAGSSTKILVGSFACVIGLAVFGTVANSLWGADQELIKEAMRLIGVTGPTGTAIDKGIEVFRKPSESSSPEVPEGGVTKWGKP